MPPTASVITPITAGTHLVLYYYYHTFCLIIEVATNTNALDLYTAFTQPSLLMSLAFICSAIITVYCK